MKTKLLLFMVLLSSVLGFSQINVGEGIEYGTPSGWTFPSVSSNLSLSYGTGCSGSYGLSTTVSSSNNYASVITSSYASNGNPISLSYLYKLESGTFSGTAHVYYELNNSGTWTQANSNSDFSTGCKTLSANIAAGVVSNGATVKFKLQINWVSGSGAISIDNILIYQAPLTPGLITEYNFDNTYSNINGLEPFAAAATTFVPDRQTVNNNPTGALNIPNINITASITGLCFNNTPRTISIWVKLNAYHASGFNYLWSYGGSGTGYGAYLNATTAVQYNVYPNQPVSTTNDLGVWNHYVFSYDGTNANIYKNGNLLLSEARDWSNLNWNKEFRLGGNSNFNGAVDDLKLYNYALSQAEVTSLFTNNTLSSSDFSQNNLEVKLYPNPVNDLLNIETPLELQSVEIYNIQCQKVLSSNQKQINVSDLAAGMYMVRIQDTDNNIATKKIVIK